MCVMPRLDKIPLNHFNSQVVIVIERYSTSVDDLDTICCFFFVFHKIGESPRKIIQPVSDFRIIEQPAQSASPNQHRTINVDVGHLGYLIRWHALDSVSDNEQLAVLFANDPPLVLFANDPPLVVAWIGTKHEHCRTVKVV